MSDAPVPRPLLPDLTARTQRQVLEIVVQDGYHPDRLQAAAGVPIRLVFRRMDEDPCSDRIVFSSPRLERRLAPRSTTVVDLPLSDDPEVRFTCGMGRYHGRIEILPSRAMGGVVAQVVPRRPTVGGMLLLTIPAVLLLGLMGSGALAVEAIVAAAIVIGLSAALFVGRTVRRPARHP